MQISHIDFSKYKRFFSFGCSFTKYIWPTWADIIGQHVPEYYNYGMAGMGNAGIFAQVVEASMRHRFNHDDLVIVMWSDMYREDRYVRDQWLTYGNIYLNENPYGKNFINNLTCERGHFIRDSAHFASVMTHLCSFNCDWDYLSMGDPVPPPIEVEYNDVERLYSDVYSRFKPSAIRTLFNNDYECRPMDLAKINHNGKVSVDLHPTPIMHMEYLSEVYGVEPNPSLVDQLVYMNEKILAKPNTYYDAFELEKLGKVERL